MQTVPFRTGDGANAPASNLENVPRTYLDTDAVGATPVVVDGVQWFRHGGSFSQSPQYMLPRWRLFAVMSPIRTAGVLFLATAASCGPSQDTRDNVEPVNVVAAPLVGVPAGGYPNYQERLMHVAINRARSAPNVVGKTASDCSTTRSARPPLMYNHDAARAARFHCASSALNNGSLSHDSYCTLRNNIGTTWGSTCDGSASCACVAGTAHFSCTVSGGHGTSFSDRADLFGFEAASEVLAAGASDGWDATWLWMSECPSSPTGEGHRLALTTAYNEIGLGYVGSSSCNLSRFYAGDLGDNGPAIYTLPAGIHRPQTGTSFDFYVNYYNTAGAPEVVRVVVDGTCKAMTLEIGTAGNGTYKTSKTVTNACHQYWFLAYTASGARRTYPEVGAWGVGSCSGYQPTADAAACEECLPGETTPCGVGQCAGKRACSLGKWGPCDGDAPSSEVCDGVDNDCTGGVPANEADSDGDGSRVCNNDCDDADPDVNPSATETCDGVDNDCDAEIDEGCPCAPGETEPCGKSEGICEKGVRACAAGSWGPCEGAVGPAAAEICGNGLDDDCDGDIDEACECLTGETRTCGTDEGACVAGTQQCEAGLWASCAGSVAPVEETCGDGEDNDCDGAVDEACGEADSGSDSDAAGADTGSGVIPDAEARESGAVAPVQGDTASGCACGSAGRMGIPRDVLYWVAAGLLAGAAIRSRNRRRVASGLCCRSGRELRATVPGRSSQ